jgi:hypothetical protein
MEKKIPKTKAECFAMLDAMLSEEDKKELKNCDNTIDYHFTLGMWIRNNWLYPLSDEDIQSLMKEFEEDEFPGLTFTIHPDEFSTEIINKYVEYLNEKE